MTWLERLPSGAWVVAGALVSLLGTVLIEAWRGRRHARDRAEAIADRTRAERREVYAEVLVSAKRAEGELYRRRNAAHFGGGDASYGIEQYNEVWDDVTGDLDERVARARLVGSAPVRGQLDAVMTYLSRAVFELVEDDSPERRDGVSPVRILEEALVFELDFRNTAETRNSVAVDDAVGTRLYELQADDELGRE
jgi:hypothetical protein